MTSTAAAVNDSIQLIIRCTNNKYADFTLQLSSASTVYELKQQVALVHPTKPVSIGIVTPSSHRSRFADTQRSTVDIRW